LRFLLPYFVALFARRTPVVPPEGVVGALLPCILEVKNLTAIPQFVMLTVKEELASDGAPLHLH
jgi:hypothetical protein